MTKDLDQRVAHAMELHYERGFIDGMQKQMQSSVDMAVNRMAQTQEPVPPPWWNAVENILNEYGLQAINFVADFKQALAQTQEPVANAVIAGALFDFMGWLTSRKERIVLSSADNASPAVDAIRDFANMRGLSLDDAKVLDWNTTPPQRTWVGLTDEEELQLAGMMDKSRHWLVAEVEAKLKEKNT